MTNLPEARLAREAEICYATVALSTDYDCWHHAEEDVTVEAVVAVMGKNVKAAQEIIRQAAQRLTGPRTCTCGQALAGAIMTAPDRVPPATRKRLELIAGHRLPPVAKPAKKPVAKAKAKPRRK